MNKRLVVEVERSSFVECLGNLTKEELCEELNGRNIEDEILCSLLDIKLPKPEEPPEPEGELSIEDTSALYDAIAEGRTKDALEIVFNIYPSGLLHPTAQLRVASLRPAL